MPRERGVEGGTAQGESNPEPCGKKVVHKTVGPFSLGPAGPPQGESNPQPCGIKPPALARQAVYD